MGMDHEHGHCKMDGPKVRFQLVRQRKMIFGVQKTVTNPHQKIVLRGLTSTL